MLVCRIQICAHICPGRQVPEFDSYAKWLTWSPGSINYSIMSIYVIQEPDVLEQH